MPNRPFYRPLAREKTRHRRNLTVMTAPDLWKAAFAETERVMSSTENWNTREAFYAANRLNEILHELYLRGEQLRFTGTEFQSTPARGFADS